MSSLWQVVVSGEIFEDASDMHMGSAFRGGAISVAVQSES
jgi:hypothetical protein